MCDERTSLPIGPKRMKGERDERAGLKRSCLTSLIVLVGCATTEQSLQKRGLFRLTHGELEALWSRTRTTRFTISEGRGTGTGTYASDGVAKIRALGRLHEGVWKIKDGKFCTQYATLRNGDERCYTFYKTGENKYQLIRPDEMLGVTLSFTN